MQPRENPSKAESPFMRQLGSGLRTAGYDPQGKIICAVSGGSDSVAMLLGMLQLLKSAPKLIVAHFNHRARGKDSDWDEDFVRRICSERSLELRVGQSKYARTVLSEEEARRERYRFIAKIIASTGSQGVAVAHTIEDQAETVLLHLARGAGISGAAGMKKRQQLKIAGDSPLTILRPMLQSTHREAAEFLARLSITPRHDASNDDWRRYARNRIRHQVLPQLTKINTKAVEALARFAETAHTQDSFIQSLAQNTIATAGDQELNTLDRRNLISTHRALASEILIIMHRRVAQPGYHLQQSHIAKMIELAAFGKPASYHLPGSAIFTTDHAAITIVSTQQPSQRFENPYPQPFDEAILKLPGELRLDDRYAISAGICKPPARSQFQSERQAFLTPGLLHERTLTVRTRRPGDRFQPLGMRAEMKLQNFFVNAKVPKEQRDRIPIVASPISGRIAWIAGLRPAEWAKHRPEHQECLLLKLTSMGD